MVDIFIDQVGKTNSELKLLHNKYTGLTCPYRTPANVTPDKGVENTLPDLTVQSDYEPISAVVARVQRGDLSLLHTQSDLGYEYDSIDDVDVNAADVEDYIDQSGDVLDRQIDLQEYLAGLTEAQQEAAGVSAGSTTQADENGADEAKNEAKEAKFEDK